MSFGSGDTESVAQDALYAVDEASLDAFRSAKPWMSNAKHFKKALVSPGAAMKMLMHAMSGVERGIKTGGVPVEIMGLMIGRPDPTSRTRLVVTDVFPLPIEGAETRVLADDAEVMNYMIQLGEDLELTRKERFMGWYHSHPFEVEKHSHCFMSAMDVSTQLAWQRLEDRNGNPWLAIVVDPLRSIAKGRPEFGAFRVYPPEYTAPTDETPDFKIVTKDSERVERWGSCWNRYYTLEIEYYMSSTAAAVLGTLSRNFLWMSNLTSTPGSDPESREAAREKVRAMSETLQHTARGVSSMQKISNIQMSTRRKGLEQKPSDAAATAASSEIAVEDLLNQVTQLAKSQVFNKAQC